MQRLLAASPSLVTCQHCLKTVPWHGVLSLLVVCVLLAGNQGTPGGAMTIPGEGDKDMYIPTAMVESQGRNLEESDHNHPTIVLTVSSEPYQGKDEEDMVCATGGQLQVTSAVTPRLNLTVKHPLFDPRPGLVPGVVYQVIISVAATEETTYRFSVLSLVDDKGGGQFSNMWVDQLCPGEDWKVSGLLFDGIIVVYNWSLDTKQAMDENVHNITFQLRYRLDSKEDGDLFETRQVLPLLKECALSLGLPTANITWSDFPRGVKKCHVTFPSPEGDRRGVVIELTRLNVPCQDGGNIYFSVNSSIQHYHNYKRLCGKLEEIPLTGRTIYFPSTLTSTTSFNFQGSPVFAFMYHLVDYCYNVTLTSSNDTLTLRPHQGLHCTFRIHLPYGNRVSVQLQVGEDPPLETEYPFPPINNNHTSAVVRNVEETPCDGLITRLWDGASSWSECTRENDIHRNVRVVSRGNVIFLLVFGVYGQTVRLWYHALSVSEVIGRCPYGWVAALEMCITVVEEIKLPWLEAEEECNRRGGHLASITSQDTQDLIDILITNRESVILQKNFSDYNRRSKGKSRRELRNKSTSSLVLSEGVASRDSYLSFPQRVPFDQDVKMLTMPTGCTGAMFLDAWAFPGNINSDPGFEDHNSYWVGASDKMYEGDFRWTDGLIFTYSNWFPGWFQDGRFRNSQPNDDTYSDQDCVELRRSYYVQTSPSTAHLTDSFMWNDMDCDTPNYFVCETRRPGANLNAADWFQDCNRTIVLSPEQPKVSVMSPDFPRRYPDNAVCDTRILALSHYRLIIEFEELLLENEPSYDYLELFDGGNDSVATRRLCGDWSTKLKLLRYVSQGPQIRLRFVSDYSHHFSGFKVKVAIANAALQCNDDDRLQMFNSSCYLFISYPEVTWQTAQQICRGMKSQLASIYSNEEDNFIISNLRESTEYSSSAIYWLGGQEQPEGHWSWTDGSHMSYAAWVPEESPRLADGKTSCLSIQWVPEQHSSGLYWHPQSCSMVGGYVCKRSSQVSVNDLNLNQTMNGTEGNLTSPNYPGQYYNNLDYNVRVSGPHLTRIVIQFSRLDLEPQLDCLYDYVELRNPGSSRGARWCDSYHNDMQRMRFVSEGHQAELWFHSDYSVAGTGFSATWWAVDVSGCPLQTLTAHEGFLASPSYPHCLINHLDCTTTILAPTGRRVWLEITDLDMGPKSSESLLELDLGSNDGWFRPFQIAGHLTDGAYLSHEERLMMWLRTGDEPLGRGFKAIYKSVNLVHEERIINLSSVSTGVLLHLNYPSPPPPHVDYIEHLVAPLGSVILLELYRVILSEEPFCPGGAGVIEVSDNYADMNGTWWFLCEDSVGETLAITSFLNTIHVRQRSEQFGVRLNGTIQVKKDTNYKLKLLRGSEESSVESCLPNPCKNGGKCVSSGSRQTCQCTSHFTGMFCALTLCELEPCLFGQCQLTATSYTCNCQAGYIGTTCDQKQRPCADNPCEGRGECVDKTDNTFLCRCHAWWEGHRCEHRMRHIPFKPLSERMLQEPFWLGLITVTVVLGIIGLVWCAKRHFPEKLEKLLAEEADRNRPSTGSHHSRPSSSREQLTGTTLVVVPSPQPGCPRSIFGRLGIRKPSLLSLTSPQGHGSLPANTTARTFSLDDLLGPPPRRTPSPRKKRNNSTPTKDNFAEKSQILHQLITPSANRQPSRKSSLGELIHLAERKINEAEKYKEGGECETTFIGSPPLFDLHSPVILDSKLEKKVTFARLLSKVSAEMSSGSEVEHVNKHPSLLNRSNSTPPSPAADPKSPHSTSSNQGSDSMSSIDVTLTSTNARLSEFFANRSSNHLLHGGLSLKNHSADSILAMFRNFSSAPIASNQKPSTSTTPTTSSPQDDVAGSDESSTSSCSFTMDSPPFLPTFHRHTIQVPVLDAMSAHKDTREGSNLLHPPTILLEIPRLGTSKCLSPIREVPTPSLSPALTPILPRSHTYQDEEEKLDESTIETNKSDAKDIKSLPFSPAFCFKGCPTSLHKQLKDLADVHRLDDSSTTDGAEKGCLQAFVPLLIVQQSSPPKNIPPVLYIPGSPPPRAAGSSNAEIESFFPEKMPGRPLKELDKPMSLDLPYPTPQITVTCNMSEMESDTESMSTANNSLGVHPRNPSGGGGMCYLSPFSMCSRVDRTASESNLSSSGYSSMASPGPSRCGSNSPLCPTEVEDQPGPVTTLFKIVQHNPSPLLYTLTGTNEIETMKSGKTQHSQGQEISFKGRSDSETLSDDLFVESNDEGIGTDHLDEKIEEGELKSAKEMEMFIGKEILDNGKILLGLPILGATTVGLSVPNQGTVDNVSDTCKCISLSSNKGKSCLQLPSIVIQNDIVSTHENHLIPVNSLSESPQSDKMIGPGKFSPQFYGRRIDKLLSTDSDDLYDCLSSDCPKVPTGSGSTPQHRKSTGRRRERRATVRGGSKTPSPTKATIMLDVPEKDVYYHPTVPRKPSPKRARMKPQGPVESSSSSESLSSIRKANVRLSPTCEAVCWSGAGIESWAEKESSTIKSSSEDLKEEATSKILQTTKLKEEYPHKISRLRTIGHQIRFLRRLEQSLKQRECVAGESQSDSCADDDDDDDDDDSLPVWSPLLPQVPQGSKSKRGLMSEHR